MRPLAASLCRAAWVAAWALGCATAGDGASAEGVPWRVDVGFAGGYRAGSWTPVVVSPSDATAAGDLIRVWAEDADGQFVRSPAVPLAPAEDGNGPPRARTCVRFGRPTGRLLIERVGASDADVHEVTLPAPLPATQRVLLVLGDVPAARRAARLVGVDQAARMHAVDIADAAARGRLAAGDLARDFDGADALLVCGRDVPLVSAATVAGIDAWVRAGGRLVFAAGGTAEAVGQGGAVASGWLPGRVERLVPLRRLAAVEAYARAGGLVARAAQAAPLVPLFADRGRMQGVVDAFDGAAATDLPLVVRRPHGFGTITWLGIDLDAEPFRSWPGADALLVRLLGERASDLDDQRATAAEVGVADLAAQLRVAVESTSADGRIAPVPFEAIIGLGLLYVGCLYPLDWWLMARGHRRPAVTWLTLPLAIAGFVAATAAIARGWHPREPRACSVAEIVDVDAGSRALRAASWAAVQQRDNGAIDVAVPAGERAAVSWWADAGTGFGAIDALLPHPSLAARDYGYGESLAALEAVPVAAAADRLFEASWHDAAGDAAVVTAALTRDAQGGLEGTVAHHLPFPLEGCRLAFAGWLYEFGRLAPGETRDLGQGRGPRSLASALARRETVREREIAPRWNPAETDVMRILEIAGFHAAAGGLGYTGLPAGRLARLDLSPLLACDRAVLFGTSRAAAAGWTTDWRVREAAEEGAARRDAASPPVHVAGRLYRIVIPLPAEGSQAR